MSHFNQFSIGLNISPTLPPGTVVGVQQSPAPLAQLGLNMLVEISTASAFLNSPTPSTRATIAVMAHLDTGASLTSIDANLAQHLGLIATGSQRIGTASGFSTVNNYAIDISFLNTPLKGIQNLMISSCTLPHFNLANAKQNPNLPTNFGVLIGRDIMSRWSVTWHGPSSSVLISD
jgi:hypothetical protein